MLLESTTNSAQKKWLFEPVEFDPAVLQNKNLISSDYCVPTRNKKGFAFKNLDESVDIWISSLPKSDRPLADLGAGYGFQTIAALKKGRNVIAVDMESEHLEVIWKSVQSITMTTSKENGGQMGNLIGVKTARLPNSSLFNENKLSGILLSEVIHFVDVGEPLQIFQDAFRWLQPGGLLVVTGASPAIAEFLVRFGATLNGERSIDEAWDVLANRSDVEIISSAATLVDVSTVRSSSIRDSIGSHMYCISTNELCALARVSGFDIERAEYIAGEKYSMKCSKFDNEALLVARKPCV